MADNDSDFDDFTETTVLLGYAESEAKDDDSLSHLGGAPIWLDPLSPADARLAKCGTCNKLMSLLLQLNGAVPESPHDRMFYVWACKEKTCRRKKGSVKAIRCVRATKGALEKAQRAEEKKQESKQKQKLVQTKASEVKTGALLFGGGPTPAGAAANPFSSGATTTAAAGAAVNPFSSTPKAATSTPAAATAVANPFSTTSTTSPASPKATNGGLSKSFADTLRISSPPTTPATDPEPLLYGPPDPWPSPLPHTYLHFYLDAELEALEPEAPTPPTPKNLDAMLTDDIDSSLPASDSAADDGTLDTAFQSFADRVAQNPEQVLRYERGGTPLLYSDCDEVAKILLEKEKFTNKKIPACGNCGKRERVVEFQIMPHAISVLECEEMGLDGMEWGCIVVGTCLCVPKVRDGNGVGWVEEWVGVQWEGRK